MKWNINKQAVNRVILGIQWTSGIFAIVMSILLFATLIQVNLHDPINTPALSTLMQKVESDPANAALKEDVRALDLLARKAYFTSWEQLRRGAVILFTAVGVFLLSWKLRASLAPSIPSKPAGNAYTW